MEFKKGKLGFWDCVSDNGKIYHIDPENLTCDCIGFSTRGYKNKGFECKHLKAFKKHILESFREINKIVNEAMGELNG